MAAEALELRLVAAPVVSLAWLGTAPGVVIVEAAGLNGPGVGRLRVIGATVAWKAPKSGAFGLAVDCSIDGTYVLRDGEDPDKWLRITAYGDYLADVTRNIYLEEVYGNVLVTDFNAATVAAGTVNTLTMRIYNVGTIPMDEVRVWLSPLDAELATPGMAGMIQSHAATKRRSHAGRSGVSPFLNGTLAAGVIGRSSSWLRASVASPLALRFTPLPAVLAYGLSISSDNVSFYSPRAEFDADTLVYGTILPGAFSTLYVRRTIPAGMVAEPRGRTDIRTSFSALF